jgi:hypothetical protein
MGDRPELTERLSRLTPVQQENNAGLLILCELVDELVVAVREQSTLLRAVMQRFTAIQAGQNRGAGTDAGAAAPHGPEGDDKGGADVQLREPGLPPPDPDKEPAPPADGPVAEQTTEPAPARRRTAGKTTAAKTTATKTAPATRQAPAPPAPAKEG